MKLNFKKFGEGSPFVILHGLFGSLDNWQTLAKYIAEQGFCVYIVDLRNHGQSPHSGEWNYKVMADDIAELLKDENLEKVILLGHSMGGKVAMQFAPDYADYVQKLLIVDIAPKYYPIHHQAIVKGLKSVDFDKINSRKEAEELLIKYIPEISTRQFLLKNLYWKEDKKLAWRFNLDVISRNIAIVGEATPAPEQQTTGTKDLPVLFIKGEKSNYILPEDMILAKKIFPQAQLVSIPGAGHWVHAEAPALFLKEVLGFCKQ